MGDRPCELNSNLVHGAEHAHDMVAKILFLSPYTSIEDKTTMPRTIVSSAGKPVSKRAVVVQRAMPAALLDRKTEEFCLFCAMLRRLIAAPELAASLRFPTDSSLDQNLGYPGIPLLKHESATSTIWGECNITQELFLPTPCPANLMEERACGLLKTSFRPPASHLKPSPSRDGEGFKYKNLVHGEVGLAQCVCSKKITKSTKGAREP